MGKTIIVLGGGYNQVPLMRMARERGYRVAVIDGSNSPMGRSNSDDFYPFSYRDEEKILALADRHDIAGIGTIGTNDAIYTAGRVALKLGLPCLYDPPEIIQRATYKHLWREHLSSLGSAIPPGKIVSREAEALEYAAQATMPLLVKPSDASGAKGISIVHDEKEMATAYVAALRHSTNKRIIIEKYIAPNSYAVESFVVDRKIYFLCVAKRLLSASAPCAGLGTFLPAILPEQTRQRVVDLNREVITALELSHGPVHIDMIIDPDGFPFLVDVGPRLVGGPNHFLIRMATGFDMLAGVFSQIIGEPFSPAPPLPSGKYYANRYITSSRRGKIREIRIGKEFYQNTVLGFELYAGEGDYIEPVGNSQDRLGSITACDDSYENLVIKLEDMLSRIEFITE